jgi:NAD(P)-dependent dehydrogenase (short-subunit alcohol dehydrogenase family)
MLLANRIAIVTGGARGIGRAIAIKFAEEGSDIIVVDIRADKAAETIKQISNNNKTGLFIPCDVSNRSQVRNMVDQVIVKFGKIDILVNNAAISPPENPIADITEEEWDKVLAVNLKSVFLCCQAVMPYMKKQKYGKIVNVSSLGAISPAPFMADYAAAKSGVVALSRSLALEAASFNVCVNALLPGITRTELHDAVIPPGMTKDEHFARAAKMVPMKRVADPEDIAGAALFLASDLSNYVTGDRILATGGLQ